ncbi:uncharacterized protein LOC143431816 isoform X1 [Xylocopa sonorina]|uniref:uncharacterized protein LOC143431816 isoform X1 n=2 Tax=Xylocopa sonorina TaxID=1818115 RepID=UPI00403AC873
MMVWPVLLFAVIISTKAAIPDPPSTDTTTNSLKWATTADCSGVIAFSATQASVDHAKVKFSRTLVDEGVGYDAQTGTFVTQCPGLYQFSFAGYGNSNLRLTLKRKLGNTDIWRSEVSAGPAGGANLVLLDMKTGDQLALFVDSGKIADSVTFSGYRIIAN